MARLARIVAPGIPHHVTARGNRREPIFFEDGDQDIYCDMLAEQAIKAGVEVWAYCLMPNHVHLTLCPETEDSMAQAERRKVPAVCSGRRISSPALSVCSVAVSLDAYRDGSQKIALKISHSFYRAE